MTRYEPVQNKMKTGHNLRNRTHDLMQTVKHLRPLHYEQWCFLQRQHGIYSLSLSLAGVRRPVLAPLRSLRWQATHWSRRLGMLLAKASTKTGTPTRTGWHVVPDYHLVTSNSDWPNLKHPEADCPGPILGCTCTWTIKWNTTPLQWIFWAGSPN